MKITIRTLSGLQKDFILDDKANMRELRTAIKENLGIPFGEYRLNVQTKNDEQICEIFNDDPLDMQVSDFLKSHSKNQNFDLSALNLYLVRLLCSKGLRGTQPLFFNPTGENTFSKRLLRIQFPEDKIPEEFCDPIHETIMDNPQVASDFRTYDHHTLVAMKYKSPYDRSKLSIIIPNVRLQEEEEKFVTQAEKNFYAENKELNSNENSATLFHNKPYTKISITSIEIHHEVLTVNFNVDEKIGHLIQQIILTTEDCYPQNNSSGYLCYGSTNKRTDRYLSINLKTSYFPIEKNVIAAVNISNRTIGLSDVLTNHLTLAQRAMLIEKKLLEPQPKIGMTLK